MEQYDEDLFENPFFKTLKSQYSSLFENSTAQRYSICVPRKSSFNDVNTNVAYFESHIFIPEEFEDDKYKTVSQKELVVQSGVITTGEGFSNSRVVPILFEETFFNSKDESYRVFCISQPLEGDLSQTGLPGDSDDWLGEESVSVLPLHSMEDVKEVLWANTGSMKTQRHLDDLLSTFCVSLSSVEKPSYRHVIETAESVFARAVQMVLKDPHLKKMVKTNGAYLQNVKTAIETYMMNKCYMTLFKTVCTCLARKDARLNKITRNLSRLQLTDLGVRMDFCQNVPRARREISNIVCHSTPLGKLSCLKRVVGALVGHTHHSTPSLSSAPIPLTTDDLLPILVFLVVKTDVPNWWAHFAFMTNFNFSKSNNDDEFGFYLATLEAALEHINSGQLCDINFDLETENLKSLQLSLSPSGGSIWQRQDSNSAAIEAFFQYVRDNNQEAVTEITSRPASMSNKSTKTISPVSSQLCHPLCTCDRCADLLARYHSRSATLTVHSRDHRGHTALHVAASSGHVDMSYLLIKKGAVVNTADNLRCTPLHLACQRGHQSIVLLLIHYNACINMQDSDGNTPLHLATINGHDDCVKAIIYCQQDSPLLNLNASNYMGDTSLHLAAKWGFSGIVTLLLENGASALVQNRKGHLATHYTNNVKLARVLQTAADTERSAILASQAETIVARNKSPAAKQKSSITSPKSSDNSSMFYASSEPTPSISETTPDKSSFSVSYRKGGKAVINAPKSPTKPSPNQTVMEKKVEKLLKSIADGDLPMAKFHLGWLSDSDGESDSEESSSPPAPRSPGSQLCHPLCQCRKCKPYQRHSIVSSSGLHVNVCNSSGMTPLHIAALHGHAVLVNLFLMRGADVNSRTTAQDATALHLACKQNKLSVVELLVKCKVRVNTRDSLGNTPLHYTSMNGNVEQASLLLESGANVNAVNRKGNTPLHHAVKYNFPHVLTLLVQYGANPDVKNSQNLTPADFIKMHQPHLLTTFEEAYAAAAALEEGLDASNLICDTSTESSPSLNSTDRQSHDLKSDFGEAGFSPQNDSGVSLKSTSTPRSQDTVSGSGCLETDVSMSIHCEAPESDHGSFDFMTSGEMSNASLNNLLPCSLVSDEESSHSDSSNAESERDSVEKCPRDSPVTGGSDSEDSTTESQKDMPLSKHVLN